MKRFGSVIIIVVMIFYFIFAPTQALFASRRGLLLWFEQLLPTLLPFSIISYIVLASGLFSFRGNGKKRRISSWEWYVILCGFLFGFPIGSKLTADLYRDGKISKKNASILCCFTNNLSPVFVTSAMAAMLNLNIHPVLYLVLYGIPFSLGIAALVFAGEQTPVQKNAAPRFHLNMQIIDAGIINGFETLIKICGYIMMFSILSELIKTLPVHNPLVSLLLVGCTEVTNGISCLAAYSCRDAVKYLLAVLFLSWNGISGLFQTASVLGMTDLSVRQYLKNKLVLSGIQSGVTGILFFGNFFI